MIKNKTNAYPTNTGVPQGQTTTVVVEVLRSFT